MCKVAGAPRSTGAPPCHWPAVPGAAALRQSGAGECPRVAGRRAGQRSSHQQLQPGTHARCRGRCRWQHRSGFARCRHSTSSTTGPAGSRMPGLRGRRRAGRWAGAQRGWPWHAWAAGGNASHTGGTTQHTRTRGEGAAVGGAGRAGQGGILLRPQHQLRLLNKRVRGAEGPHLACTGSGTCRGLVSSPLVYATPVPPHPTHRMQPHCKASARPQLGPPLTVRPAVGGARSGERAVALAGGDGWGVAASGCAAPHQPGHSVHSAPRVVHQVVDAPQALALHTGGTRAGRGLAAAATHRSRRSAASPATMLAGGPARGLHSKARAPSSRPTSWWQRRRRGPPRRPGRQTAGRPARPRARWR